MQGALDLQSGVLHAEEKDYKTAYALLELTFVSFSYFFETLESFSSIDDKRAISALKYMLLCKIMLNLVCFAFYSRKTDGRRTRHRSWKIGSEIPWNRSGSHEGCR